MNLLRELMEAEAIDSNCIFGTIIPHTVKPLRVVKKKGATNGTLERNGISREQLSG